MLRKRRRSTEIQNLPWLSPVERRFGENWWPLSKLPGAIAHSPQFNLMFETCRCVQSRRKTTFVLNCPGIFVNSATS